MYLTPAAVRATVDQIAALSAPGSRLVLNYSVPSWFAKAARATFGRLSRLARGEDPMADEPNRSAWTPQRIRALLAAVGFTVVADENLATSAARLGLMGRNTGRLRTFRILLARR